MSSTLMEVFGPTSYVMDREPNGSTQGINITSTIRSSSSSNNSPVPVPTPHVVVATTTVATPSTTPDPREYYKTYDVMTGVRIAATLGSFFGLMVLLVLYKSKSKTEKAMEDPKFTAAAVAEVEEEERQLQLALEATAYQQLNPRRSRRSLDMTSAQFANWSRPSTRFSSVGGYSSLMEPPIRTSATRLMPCFVDEESPAEEEEEAGSLYDDVYYNSHLDVPRRPSNITCSSSGSSYLERRDSAVALGLPAMPAHKCRSSRRQSSPLPEIYDFYYPIDIRVTQPTPGGSPCGSDRTIYDRVVDPPSLIKPKLAPLASISSCNSSLGTDYPEVDPQSYTSDSVFHDDEEDEEDDDTDREVEEFSTDSDVNSEEGACYVSSRKRLSISLATISGARNQHHPYAQEQCMMPKISNNRSSKSSSTLVEGKELSQLSLCESVRRLSVSSEKLEEKRSWAQETLF